MLVDSKDIWCCWMPWHKWKIIEQLSRQSQKIECQYCHRQYGINHDFKVVLPWNDVKDFYCH